MKQIAGLILSVALVFNMVLPATAQGNDTYLSEEIQGYCHEIASKYGICEELLLAIIESESSGVVDAYNEKYGCTGLMQINPRWHQDRMERLGVTDLTDAYSNILVGTDYLMELADKYGDVGIVLMVYHGESDALQKAEQGILSKYAKKILERSAQLEREHGK